MKPFLPALVLLATAIVAPVQADDAPGFHFVVYGDRTYGPAAGLEVLKSAVEETNRIDPDLVMTVGDLVNGYGATESWIKQAEEYRAIMAGLHSPWFPVAGNHDVYWRDNGPPAPREHEPEYERHFAPLWYSFTHKNSGFLVLYTDEPDPTTGKRHSKTSSGVNMSSDQLSWIRETLGAMRALDHVFVFLHHPRWLTHRYPPGNWDQVHATLAAPGNVRAVFAGHVHRINYAGVRDGIAYHTLGATGGKIPFHQPQLGYLHHIDIVAVGPTGTRVTTVPIHHPGGLTEGNPDQKTAAKQLENWVPTVAASPGPSGHTDPTTEISVSFPNPTPYPLAITASIDGPPTIANAVPDHLHIQVPPGRYKNATFRIPLAPSILSTHTENIHLDVTRELLGKTQRLILPAISFPLFPRQP